MTTPAKIQLVMTQGKTFSKVFRWAQPRKAYSNISAATVAAPCVLTVPDHGVPDGWWLRISNCRGMTELNSDPDDDLSNPDSYYRATVIDDDTIELNAVNAAGFRPYTGGGQIEFDVPVDLTGYTGRAQIRASAASTEILLDLDVIVDEDADTITVQASAVETADLDFVTGVYDLEMVAPGGQVYGLAYGSVKLQKEVTR